MKGESEAERGWERKREKLRDRNREEAKSKNEEVRKTEEEWKKQKIPSVLKGDLFYSMICQDTELDSNE